MTKDPEELYNERLKRIEDAIALKVPDRVPVLLLLGFYPAYYYGISCQDYMYDPQKAISASIKVQEDLQLDLAENPFGTRVIGEALQVLDYKQLLWPGHGLKSNSTYQYVEGEYMKPHDYDHFIEDPTDWIMRVYLPSICGTLKPFAKLTPFKNFVSYILGIPYGFAPFAEQDVQQAIDILKRVGEISLKNLKYAKKYENEMAKRGFPLRDGGVSQAPFDTLGDFFRGTQELMLDMYRRPEKILKAIDVLTPWMIQMGVDSGKKSGNPRIFIPLHKGSDGFMSEEQFKTFYWPSLRELILGLINEGMNPILFLEANYTSRLEIMRDVPPGKVVYHMENTDMAKAKDILGDRICLRGNVPASLLSLGSPDEVDSYCKKLIREAGKEGGFILDAGVPVEDAKYENIKTLVESSWKYGHY